MLAIKETNVCGWHAQKNPQPMEILLTAFNTRSFVTRCRKKEHIMFTLSFLFLHFFFCFFLSLVEFMSAIKMQRVRLKSTSFRVNWIFAGENLTCRFFLSRANSVLTACVHVKLEEKNFLSPRYTVGKISMCGRNVSSS